MVMSTLISAEMHAYSNKFSNDRLLITLHSLGQENTWFWRKSKQHSTHDCGLQYMLFIQNICHQFIIRGKQDLITGLTQAIVGVWQCNTWMKSMVWHTVEVTVDFTSAMFLNYTKTVCSGMPMVILTLNMPVCIMTFMHFSEKCMFSCAWLFCQNAQ